MPPAAYVYYIDVLYVSVCIYTWFHCRMVIREPLLSLSLISSVVKKRFLLLFPVLINVMLHPHLPVIS